jgi:hypothetical protein
MPVIAMGLLELNGLSEMVDSQKYMRFMKEIYNRY